MYFDYRKSGGVDEAHFIKQSSKALNRSQDDIMVCLEKIKDTYESNFDHKDNRRGDFIYDD